MALFFLAIIIFIIADILIRYAGKKLSEKKSLRERQQALSESLRLDFSREAKTLKRAEVENPKARILCVDDEAVILDSFRKILVLDGYSVDTVQVGQEALGLVQTHHYDFVFTDLKMPEMDGVEVVKAVKHLRPDIDVIIITGFATVETAVECMKYGAMDYVQKPFTEDELLAFVKKTLIRRQDRIQKQLKPQVHITHLSTSDKYRTGEFSIPGGVFISKGHCWVSMAQDGSAKIGIDDFAKKLIGKVDAIEFPNLGMTVKSGQPLFSVIQGNRRISFYSPLSGQVTKTNTVLDDTIESLDITPYERNWICIINAENLDTEISSLKIGKSAVALYHDDIDRFKEHIEKSVALEKGGSEAIKEGGLFIGALQDFDDKMWERTVTEFFKR